MLVVFAAGALVQLPSLRTELILDDHIHSAMLDGSFPVARHPLDLYNFVDDGDRAALLDRGLIPWWSHPKLTIKFFRPLSSALLWADHSAFGNSALPRHLHSYLWWALAVFAASLLFRHSLTPRVAWLATFAYALAPCHSIPIAWIANREALVSLTFGTFALIAYLRWRENRRLGDAAFALLFFSCAVFAGEYGLSFTGYVLAFELVQRGERVARRAVGILPFAVPAAVYLAVRTHLGYGSIGSGYYLDPIHAPLRFLWMAPRRLATLLAEGWLSLDQDALWDANAWLLIPGVVALGAVLLMTLHRSLRNATGAQRQTAAWLALGSGFALAPVLAVVPAPRLIGASVLGFAALAALIIDAAWFPSDEARAEHAAGTARQRGRAWFAGLVAVLLAFAQLVHGPATAWLVGRRTERDSLGFARQLSTLAASLPDPANADVTIVLGSAGVFFAPFNIAAGAAIPRRFRVLAVASHVLLLRQGPRTLEAITGHGQGLFPWGETNLHLSGRELTEGEVFECAGMRVTVLEVEGGLPRIARFEFDQALDAPNAVWLHETRAGYLQTTPPAEGFGQPYDFSQ